MLSAHNWDKKREEHQWHIVEEQYKRGELIEAKVISSYKDGLVVDVAGLRGRVPLSHVSIVTPEDVASGGENKETAAKLQNLRDKELKLKIIEVNREQNSLILSERLALQEWRQHCREKLLQELKIGEVRHGIVSIITNFGVFVDIGGTEELVRINHLVQRRICHPSEVVQVGQEVQVQVIGIDKEKRKMVLSLKQARADFELQC